MPAIWNSYQLGNDILQLGKGWHTRDTDEGPCQQPGGIMAFPSLFIQRIKPRHQTQWPF